MVEGRGAITTNVLFARMNALAETAAIRLMLHPRRPLFFQNEEEKHVKMISESRVLGELFGIICMSAEEKKFTKSRTTLLRRNLCSSSNGRSFLRLRPIWTILVSLEAPCNELST